MVDVFVTLKRELYSIMKVKLPGVVVTVEFFAPATSLLRGSGAIQAEVVKALDPAAHMT